MNNGTYVLSPLRYKKIGNDNPIPILMETMPYCPDFMLGYDTNSNIYMAMPDDGLNGFVNDVITSFKWWIAQ